MPELGFALSSEDHEPKELVRQAALAERSGFSFLTISDHYHPWLHRPGPNGVVWGPPVARPPGPQRVRVGHARRDRGGDGDDPGLDGCDMPDDPHPSRDRCPGG